MLPQRARCPAFARKEQAADRAPSHKKIEVTSEPLIGFYFKISVTWRNQRGVPNVAPEGPLSCFCVQRADRETSNKCEHSPPKKN